MEFEFTDTINVSEYDLNEMVRRVKRGEKFYVVYYDIMAGYDDHDYYSAPLIEDRVKEEVCQRIKQKEQSRRK